MQTRLDLYERVTPLAGRGIWERDFENGTFYWNRMIRDILGVDDDFSPELEESIRFYKHPDEFRRLLQEAIESGAFL